MLGCAMELRNVAPRPFVQTNRVAIAAPVAGFRRLTGPAKCIGRSKVVTRASSNFQGFKDDPRVKQAMAVGEEKAKALVEDAKAVLGDALSKAKDIKIDFDIKNLVNYNFVVQLFLTVVSWAVVFTTTHSDIAKGRKVTLPVVMLLVGVLLSGFSTFMSFTYLRKVKDEGEHVMDGFKAMKDFYQHIAINFIGIAATVVALQAEVGTMFASALTGAVKTSTDTTSVAAMAQAATNTLLAHIVSVGFLVYLVYKITGAYEELVAWSNSIRVNLPPSFSK